MLVNTKHMKDSISDEIMNKIRVFYESTNERHRVRVRVYLDQDRFALFCHELGHTPYSDGGVNFNGAEVYRIDTSEPVLCVEVDGAKNECLLNG